MAVRAVVVVMALVVDMAVRAVVVVMALVVSMAVRVRVDIVAGVHWPVHAPASLAGLCGALL
jgi:hypothetical protein